jgi:hypothetical protein
MDRYGWGRVTITQLAEALDRCPLMDDEPGRKALVQELSFKSEIEGSVKQFDHVMNIVKACANHTRGIEALADALWRRDTSGHVIALFDLLDSLHQLQVRWQEMVELRALFAFHSVLDAAGKEAYRALTPAWQGIPLDWARDEIFLCALDHLAATSVTEDMVLFRYLLLCLPSMVPDVQLKVRAWMALIALRLQVDMVRLEQEIAQEAPGLVRASSIIEEPVVLVRIAPMTIGGYKIDGWLPRRISRELSPNFGDGLKDQAAAWA